VCVCVCLCACVCVCVCVRVCTAVRYIIFIIIHAQHTCKRALSIFRALVDQQRV